MTHASPRTRPLGEGQDGARTGTRSGRHRRPITTSHGQVSLRKVVKRFDDTEAVRGIDLDIADKEFVVLVGPSGCGKIDDAADDRRPRGDHRRRDHGRRRGGQRRAAEGPRHGDGVPELRALPAHDRVREHVVRAAAQALPEGRDRAPRRGGRPHPRHHRTARAQAAAAFRRPAPARRHGPRDRAQSRRYSCSTSRCRISTPSCACRCAPRSSGCIRRCAPPRSMSPTTRSRR